jgi:hypothetical protein
MKTKVHFSSHLAQFFLQWEVCRKKVDEKIKTHVSRSIIFFFENLAFYEIMRKNISEPDRPQLTLLRMRIACWISEATNTQSEYGILIAFPLQQWLYERGSILRYTYIAYLVYTAFYLYC